ncbi:MAG: DUF4342 domain-containing protein, partial [Theionarchaea archaeon]|nr:DUF4342 domain-containing protein [Theionarchaea archaeon]
MYSPSLCTITFKRDNMTTCKRCGAELPENAQYCHRCGASVRTEREEFYIDSDHLIEKIKELIHEGNVTRVIVKDENDKLLLEIPV